MKEYKHKCPVCQKYVFLEPYINCPICNWCNFELQEDHPDWKKMDNIMSLNEARVAYKEGREIY